MNAFPTVLSPWFVVVKYRELGHNACLYYYTSATDEASVDDVWNEDPKEARLFLSLTHAARAAKSIDGQVMVLWDKAQLSEYGRSVGR